MAGLFGRRSNAGSADQPAGPGDSESLPATQAPAPVPSGRTGARRAGAGALPKKPVTAAAPTTSPTRTTGSKVPVTPVNPRSAASKMRRAESAGAPPPKAGAPKAGTQKATPPADAAAPTSQPAPPTQPATPADSAATATAAAPPGRTDDRELQLGYLAAALLAVAAILELLIRHGTGAPAHPSVILPALGLIFAVVMAATMRLRRRLISAAVALLAAVMISGAQVPHSLNYVRDGGEIVGFLYGLGVSFRNSRAQSVKRAAERAAGQTRPGRGNRPTPADRRAQSRGKPAPAGPRANSRYTPPKAKRTGTR